MTSVKEALAAARALLAKSGIEQPGWEASLLLNLASGIGRAEQIGGDQRILPQAAQVKFRELVERRRAREPFAFLQGTREFFGRPFLVGKGTLIPRPESELLIDVANSLHTDSSVPLRVLDLGTGSGCLLVTLLLEFFNAIGLGIDRAEAAIGWTRRNAALHDVAARARLVQGNWAGALGGDAEFDLIVCNPPYIAAGDLADLEPELHFEPHDALSPGPTGLEAYRDLTDDLRRLLAPGGMVLLEIGRGQEGHLADWFGRCGFDVRSHRDLAGIVRCLQLEQRA